MPSSIPPHSAGRRITATLFLTQSLFGASQIATFTLLAIVAADLAKSESAAGVPSTLMFMARAAGAYPLGWLMDRFGRRRGLSLGYLVAAVGAAVSVFSIEWASFLGFCAGAALSGTGRGASEQARFAAAEAHPVERRARVIGIVVFAGTIGAIGGPMLVAPSGAWAVHYGLIYEAGPYLIGAALAALGGLLTFVFLRPDPLEISRRYAPSTPGEPRDDDGRPLREIFADPTVRFAVAAMVVGQFVMTILMVITPLHMHHYDHSTQAISGVIMAHALGMFGLSHVTGWCVSRWGREAMIRAGVVTLVLSSLIAPLSPRFITLAAALFLLGLGWNFCFIAGSSLLSDALAPQERGRVQGANEMLIALSASIGSLGTGVAFEQGGMVAVSAGGLIMALALGGYSLIAVRSMMRYALRSGPG